MTTECKYANHYGWTDITPYKIVKHVSDKTLEIRRMKAERCGDWTPEFVQGGFSAICVNQTDQRWFITSDSEEPVLRIRRHKDGRWYHRQSLFRLAVEPIYFYDYNF